MKRIQPPTLVRLMLIGFVLVTLPLVGAIVTAIIQVDGFAKDNRQALVSVQQNTGTSRALADRITEMERTARQYQALADPTYLDLYKEHRAEVRAMFDRLIAENSDPELMTYLTLADDSEIAVNEVVESIGDDLAAEDLEAAFTSLRDNVLAVVQAHNNIARELGNSMPTKAASLQRLLVGQAALVIPLSIGLAILFGLLIARPVRQIDFGIRSLGRGAFSEPVRVRGTRDLEELGMRLDWLRLRLIELEAQKAQFLRNVSHELKTPLTNIREGAELLLDDLTEHTSQTEKQSITRILRDNSIRLQQMIEELLRYGADGDLTPEAMHEVVQLDQLIEEVLDQSRLAIAARSVTLCTSLMPLKIEGNAKRLRVIIDNLISNATKYTPSGGQIQVELKSTNRLITLDVKDNGPGIREKDAAYLFDWFYSGPPPPDAVIGSAGMGLAIAQEYAQQHDGSIQLIESSIGAHFRLALQERHDDEI